MFRTIFAVAALALSASTASAATVSFFNSQFFANSQLRINMTAAAGLTHIQSFNRFDFSTAPVATNLTTRVTAPNGRKPNIVSRYIADTWSGIVQSQLIAPGTFTMFGLFLSQTPKGTSALTFLPNGTWNCSGDCGIYTFWRPTGLMYPSSASLTSGTYDVQRVPLPGALGLLSAALIAAFGALRRRKA